MVVVKAEKYSHGFSESDLANVEECGAAIRNIKASGS